MARGYANASQLSGFLWDGTPVALTARALLYAQRGVALFPENADVFYARAYAEAFAGFPKSALDDLQTARKLSANGTEPWHAGVVDKLARYDTGSLVEVASRAHAAGDHKLAQLAAFAAFLTVDRSGPQASVIRIAQAAQVYLVDSPRLAAAISALAGPGFGSEVCRDADRAVVQAMLHPDFIASVSPEVASLAKSLTVETIAPADRHKFMVTLATAEEAAVPPAMSWRNIARVLDDATFVSLAIIARRVGFDEEVWPIVEDHRWSRLFTAYRLRIGSEEAFLTELKSLQIVDCTYAMEPFSTDWRKFEGEKQVEQPTPMTLLEHAAESAWDLERILFRYDLGEDPQSHRSVTNLLKSLEAVAPDSPVAMATRINVDWANAESRIPQWMEQTGGHPTLALAVGRKYISLKRYKDAADAIQKYIEMSPDIAGYRSLADCYMKAGDDAKWLATVDRFLDEPAFGLEHAKLCSDVSKELLQRKRYELAVKYAERSAQSGAQWARWAAIRANEKVGNWKRAEELVFANSSHYGDPLVYVAWCIRTGHGDKARAADAMLQAKRQVEGSRDREARADRIVIHLLEGNDEAAEKLATAEVNATGDPWAGLQAITLAMQRKDNRAADAAIKATISPKKRFRMPNGAVRFALEATAGQIRDSRLAKRKSLDEDRLKKILENDDQSDTANVYYFAGRYSESTGDIETAKRFYQLAIDTELPKTAVTQAAVRLRALGVEPYPQQP